MELAGNRDEGEGARGADDLEALLAAAQRGDRDAYRRFLHAATPFIRAVARRRCWSDDMAADVVQDALLTVHRVRHTYQPGRPVKPWLAAIATRRAVDAARRTGRVHARELGGDPAYETFADPRANADEVDHDAPRVLAGMTQGLSPGQREALELVKLREMSLVEASAASGQSVASLKVNIHRAMKKLKAALAQASPPPDPDA